MISEVAFARDFSSFWRVATPTMDGYVRRLNAGLYDRDYEPMRAQTAPERRAFVNEVAFEVFCRVVAQRQNGAAKLNFENAAREAAALIAEDAASSPRAGDYHQLLSPDETEDAREQVVRLTQRLIIPSKEAALCKLPFRGCGLIDSCAGDVLIGTTLYEIKAGDRAFRSIDIRQILTYLTLNYMGGPYAIKAVGLVNPRNGISIEQEVDDLCFEVSGRDASGLLSAIAYRISSGDLSG